MSLVVSLIGFNFLILAHELGHYGIARALGIHAQTMSIGFGPTILRWVGRYTEYRLCVLPIGGYVRFNHESQDAAGQGAGHYDGLSNATRRTRMLVTMGGPLANVLVAMVIYSCLFAGNAAVIYEFQREQTTHLSAVGTVAQTAGLQAQDVIVAVNDQSVRSFGDVTRLLSQPQRNMKLTLARTELDTPLDFEPLTTRIDGLQLWWPRVDQDARRIVITLGDRDSRIRLIQDCQPTVGRFGGETLFDAVRLGANEAVVVIRVMGRLVGKWFDGTEEPAVQSVVKMTQASARSFERGWAWFLSLLALFSMNLAVLNLLPLPGLDGGRLFVDVLEWVSGRALPSSVTRMMHAVGMLCLLSFIVVVMVKEVLDLVP